MNTDLISMDKKYKYRNGIPARVLCIDSGRAKYPVLSLPPDGTPIFHTANGRYYFNNSPDSLHAFDLIEVSPYEDFKIDEPVVVWQNHNDPATKYIRYFAGVSDTGLPTTWIGGATSWSVEENTDLIEQKKNIHTCSLFKVWDNCMRLSDYEKQYGPLE